MKFIVYILLGLSLTTSCSKDTNTPPPFTAGAEVNTNSANAILCNSASFSGIIKDSVSFIEKGIVYAITTNPSITNNKLLDPNSGLTISAKSNTLLENTKYFYRAYIIKAGNNIVYGGEGNFTTPKCSGGGGGGGIDSNLNLIIDSNFFMEIQVDGQTHFLKQGGNGSKSSLVLSTSSANKLFAINFVKGSLIHVIGINDKILEVGSYPLKLGIDDAVSFNGNIDQLINENTYFSGEYISRSKASGSCKTINNGYQTITINITKKQFVTGKGYHYILPNGGGYTEFNLNFASNGGYIYEGSITGKLVKDNNSKDCLSDELKNYTATFRLIAPNL